MTPRDWIEMGGLAVALIGLYLRDRAIAEKLAEHRARIEARVDNMPAEIRGALLEWQGPFLKDLNGTYMRTPLIEQHIKTITDTQDRFSSELLEIKREIRTSVRHEMANILQGRAATGS